MQETDSPLAGEMSGHMFFGGDYYGFDDALFAAARLLDYVAKTGEPISTLLSNMPVRCSTPELRVECSEDEKFAIVARAVEHFAAKYDTSDIDGVRITFADGWGLIRASNTQPVLVMRFEASNDANLAVYRGEVEEWLREQGVG
jgi:phosphomannomutase/phosphoglucomutase